jgi:hypothetical protein
LALQNQISNAVIKFLQIINFFQSVLSFLSNNWLKEPVNYSTALLLYFLWPPVGQMIVLSIVKRSRLLTKVATSLIVLSLACSWPKEAVC